MTDIVFSKKGLALIELYKQMANEGYQRSDGSKVEDAFADFELRTYRPDIKNFFDRFGVKTVLDYGCGGSNWETVGFDENGQSAKEYFQLSSVFRYEPARNIDERRSADGVVCFDVLEHIFIEDLPAVIRDLFSYANKLLVINVACYPAAALLPNGENAHVSVRNPYWWKGMIDLISLEFPDVAVSLLCSTAWRQTSAFKIWKACDWADGEHFVTND